MTNDRLDDDYENPALSDFRGLDDLSVEARDYLVSQGASNESDKNLIDEIQLGSECSAFLRSKVGKMLLDDLDLAARELLTACTTDCPMKDLTGYIRNYRTRAHSVGLVMMATAEARSSQALYEQQLHEDDIVENSEEGRH